MISSLLNKKRSLEDKTAIQIMSLVDDDDVDMLRNSMQCERFILFISSYYILKIPLRAWFRT